MPDPYRKRRAVKRFWKRVRWRLEYLAVVPLWQTARRIPYRWLPAVARCLAWVAFRLLHFRRRVALENLRHAFAGELNGHEFEQLAARAYGSLALTMLEFLAFDGRTPQQLRELVRIEGLEHLEQCRRSGRGAILCSGHFGNWELMGATLAARGYPIRFLVKDLSNPLTDRIQNGIRRRAGVTIVRQGLAVRDALRALRNGEFVGMLADQDGGPGGQFMEFLGRPASVFRGVALFAYRAGCPIVTTAIHRLPDGSHRMVLERPLRSDPAWDEATAVEALTRKHVQRLEENIRKAPENYLWVHRRWKTRAPLVTKQKAGTQ